AAVGVILRNPALAARAIVLWSYAAEPFISTLSYRAHIYLPGGTRESLVHHHSAHHHIPPPLTGELILAGQAAAAAPAFTRRDAACRLAPESMTKADACTPPLLHALPAPAKPPD